MRRLLLILALCLCAPAQAQHRIYEEWIDTHPQERGEAALRRDMLDAHNAERARVGVPPLRWNAALAADAMVYAKQLARTRIFAHSKPASRSSRQGENLWMGTRDAYSYADMADGWLDEARDYVNGNVPNISRTGRWQDVGHYSQMIWRTTTDMGCAMASSADDDYLVCRYSPPGNVYGSNAVMGAPVAR